MSESTPEFLSLQLAMEQARVSETARNANAGLKGTGFAPAPVSNLRSFMSPTHPNDSFLVVTGATVKAPMQMSSVMGIEPHIRRDGDVWATFSSGVCSTEDPIILAWLEAHSGDAVAHGEYHREQGSNVQCGTPVGLCRENGPGVAQWAELKLGQLPLANRPQNISPDLDVDAIFRGDYNTNKRFVNSDAARMAQTVESNESAAAERVNG